MGRTPDPTYAQQDLLDVLHTHGPRSARDLAKHLCWTLAVTRYRITQLILGGHVKQHSMALIGRNNYTALYAPVAHAPPSPKPVESKAPKRQKLKAQAAAPELPKQPTDPWGRPLTERQS